MRWLKALSLSGTISRGSLKKKKHNKTWDGSRCQKRSILKQLETSKRFQVVFSLCIQKLYKTLTTKTLKLEHRIWNMLENNSFFVNSSHVTKIIFWDFQSCRKSTKVWCTETPYSTDLQGEMCVSIVFLSAISWLTFDRIVSHMTPTVISKANFSQSKQSCLLKHCLYLVKILKQSFSFGKKNKNSGKTMKHFWKNFAWNFVFSLLKLVWSKTHPNQIVFTFLESRNNELRLCQNICARVLFFQVMSSF